MRSLRFQFFSFVAVLLILLLLMLNIYPIIASRDTVFQEKENAMLAQAASLSSSLAKLDKADRGSISEVLRLLDFSGFDDTVVTDPDGNILYSSGGFTGNAFDNEDISTALRGKNVFRSEYTGDAFNSSCAVPISSQGKLTGSVYLTERDTARAQIINSTQFQVRSVSLAIAILALVLATIYSTLVIRRVQDLARSMRIVADGDYQHRITITGNDEITQLGNEFNALTMRLGETERQRRRFVSDASHELKTPLASIRLLSDSIVQTENMDAQTVREFVTDIGHEAERLQRTTEKLLNLSRLDDDITVQSEPVDMKQVALDALVVLRPLAMERNVKFHCDLEDGCVAMATVDDMFHIFFNLMENAVKYNVEGGSVNLILKNTDSAVQFTVEDTGIGIPESETYNIFGRFYRIDKARSREAGGSGLGLSIVHDAVKAHGGTITVGQNKPQGSRFVVSFPIPSEDEISI